MTQLSELTPSQVWIHAARPRTLPLALSSIVLGTLLAASRDAFRPSVALLCILTATFLQILSNLANDYGDSVHGADSPGRDGPQRAVQSGAVSPRTMRWAIITFSLLSTVSGLTMVWIAFGSENQLLVGIFVGLGALAILAAITYTAGWRPYGYAGLGDLSVLLFFGWVGVMGSYFLQTRSLDWEILLPATSCGLMAVAVLNVNNMRDISSDRSAGKQTLPVRVGIERARTYHKFLLAGAVLCALLYVFFTGATLPRFLFLLSLPFVLRVGLAVSRLQSDQLDPMLKRTVGATLLFVLTFGIGQLL